jgi:hypothetical protein
MLFVWYDLAVMLDSNELGLTTILDLIYFDIEGYKK